jgi:hypothetical protein
MPLLQPPEDSQAWCCMAGVACPPARLQHCCFTLLAARTAAAVQHKACERVGLMRQMVGMRLCGDEHGVAPGGTAQAVLHVGAGPLHK